MTENDIKNNENHEQSEQEPKSYDVMGLIIGAVVGIFLSMTGVVNFLMGIIAGMFLGLVTGTFFKKK